MSIQKRGKEVDPRPREDRIQVAAMAKILVLAIVSVVLSVSLPRGEAASKDEVRAICANTQDPPYCAGAINADPRTAAANSTGLAKIAIDLAAGGAGKAETLAVELITKAAEGLLRDKYIACRRNFAVAAEDIGEAATELAAADPKSVSELALNGLIEGQECRDGFDVPPRDPSSDLPGLVGNLITLCGAVFYAAQHVV